MPEQHITLKGQVPPQGDLGQNWSDAVRLLGRAFLESTKDSAVGSLLRLTRLGVPKSQKPLEEEVQDYVLDAVTPLGGIFAGQQALKAPLGSLKKAKKMWKAGSMPKKVSEETGWITGASIDDTKSRWEIDDSKAVFTKGAMENLQGLLQARKLYLQTISAMQRKYGNIVKDRTNIRQLLNKTNDQEYKRFLSVESGLQEAKDKLGGGTVGNILHHPELFDNYPALREIRVNPVTDGGGAYSDTSRSLDLGITESLHDPMDSLLHELQHGVQHIEGFPKGGSPSMFAADPTVQASISKKIEELANKIKTNPELNTLANRKRLARLNHILDEMEEKNQTAYQKYLNLAGEYESRKVTERRYLSPKERVKRLPWDGENRYLEVR